MGLCPAGGKGSRALRKAKTRLSKEFAAVDAEYEGPVGADGTDSEVEGEAVVGARAPAPGAQPGGRAAPGRVGRAGGRRGRSTVGSVEGGGASGDDVAPGVAAGAGAVPRAPGKPRGRRPGGAKAAGGGPDTPGHDGDADTAREGGEGGEGASPKKAKRVTGAASGTKKRAVRPKDGHASPAGEDAALVAERARVTRELTSMKIVELRTLVTHLGLPKTGLKAELIQRMLDHKFPPGKGT
jgi:hypothetical protein